MKEARHVRLYTVSFRFCKILKQGGEKKAGKWLPKKGSGRGLVIEEAKIILMTGLRRWLKNTSPLPKK